MKNCWLRRKRHRMTFKVQRVSVSRDYEIVRTDVACSECGWLALLPGLWGPKRDAS